MSTGPKEKDGKTKFSKNGFAVIELLVMDVSGEYMLSGFIVRGPNGAEWGPFDLEEAMFECENLGGSPDPDSDPEADSDSDPEPDPDSDPESRPRPPKP